MRTRMTAAIVAAGMALSVGCASTQSPTEERLASAQREVSDLKGNLSARERELARQKAENERLQSQLQAAATPAVSSGPASGSLLPPAGKPGECYARVFVPPKFTTSEERVLKRAASERIEIVPAQYGTAEERVLVKEAVEKLEVIPAEYGYREERVLVKEASKKMVEVPAVYETVSEQVLVRPARTMWKKGRGPMERVDEATGEIMCLVEEPAVYKTVTSRVLKTPATTRVVEIPAEYKTVKKRVVVRPETTRKVTIPAEYRTVKVRTVVKPPTERRIEIPAQYQTITKRDMVKDGELAWRPILCETNADRTTVTAIQRALKSAGHDPGPIDGVIGRNTLAAVTSYQKSKGLPSGQITYATLDSLNVKVGR